MRIDDIVLNEILCSPKPWEAAEIRLSGELLELSRECFKKVPPYDMWAGLHVLSDYAKYKDPSHEYNERTRAATCAMANAFRSLFLERLGR